MTGNSHLDIVRNLQLPFGEGFPFDQAMCDLTGFYCFSGFQSPPREFFAEGVHIARLVFLVAQYVLQRSLPFWTGQVLSEGLDGRGV
jgi:hypothetical protein